MTRPKIRLNDIKHLLAEQDLSPFEPADWFEKNGLDPDILRMLYRASHKGFVSLCEEAVENGDDGDPKRMFGDICATFMMSGFQLGWESRKQFGGKPDE